MDEYLASINLSPMARQYAFAFAFLVATSGLFAQGDTCTNALPILTGFYHADGPTTGDGGGSFGCGGSGQNGDWYVYTATFTGTINITSCNDLNESSDDTYLKVLTGSCGSLTCVAYNDDMGSNSCPGYPFATYLDMPVTAGQSYYFIWTSMFNSDDFWWTLTECYGTVSGATYHDANNNGVRDAGEQHMNTMLEVNPGGTMHYSGTETYSFCTDSGSYTITVPNPPLYHTAVPASRTYSVTAQGQLVTDKDFGFQSIPGIYDGRADIWGWNPWIGNNTSYHINYRNVGTESIDGNIVLTLDTLTSFVSSSVAPTSVSGQTVTWSIAGLAAGDMDYINVTYHTDSTALTSDVVTAGVNFTIDQTEQTPADNADAISAHPTTSFDPNEKLVNVATITPDEVASGKALEYTVHFQNTGTQPAVNIVLRDMIDADLDLSSFEMIGATHANQISINGNEIAWTFANILLPDSGTDMEASQGGVHFRIRPKSSVLPGTLMLNTGAIYFDYNDPVITNTVETEVVTSSGIAAAANTNAMLIYPSPGNGNFHLRWNEAAVAGARLEVLDITGRVLHSQHGFKLMPGQVLPLDLTNLADGQYIVRIFTSMGMHSADLSVQH
jgi:uncharacterized repeat protein (TIGR01451 family)